MVSRSECGRHRGSLQLVTDAKRRQTTGGKEEQRLFPRFYFKKYISSLKRCPCKVEDCRNFMRFKMLQSKEFRREKCKAHLKNEATCGLSFGRLLVGVLPHFWSFHTALCFFPRSRKLQRGRNLNFFNFSELLASLFIFENCPIWRFCRREISNTIRRTLSSLMQL